MPWHLAHDKVAAVWPQVLDAVDDDAILRQKDANDAIDVRG